jgi:hypothetical protein
MYSDGAELYIDSIALEEIGEVAAYTPQTISDTKWRDTTSNANHGTITGATRVNPIRHATFESITFPETQSASTDPNSLDDYEEGVWSPINNNFTTWSSPTFDANYVKIGKLVHINCRQTGGTVDPGGVQRTLKGLPFPVAHRSICGVGNDGPTLVAHGLVYPGGLIYVREDIGSQTSLVFSAVYMTTN